MLNGEGSYRRASFTETDLGRFAAAAESSSLIPRRVTQVTPTNEAIKVLTAEPQRG